tara:strand:+ start:717 stop:1787 length:1071 start_codon:yes stop_codon:yes gene_type:complete
MSKVSKVRVNEWGQDTTTFSGDNPNGKIQLTEQPTFSTHRSGWDYAVGALEPLHNSRGISFYGFLENEFYWRLDECKSNGVVPIRKPWVGFFHNPQNYPWWFGPKGLPEVIINMPEFKKSIDSCLGLFTLTEYHADFYRNLVNVPVSVLCHPTEIPEKQFNFNNFLKNPKKRLLNVGYWLRKINSIYYLPVDNNIYTKTRILPYEANSSPHQFVHGLRLKELRYDYSTSVNHNYYYSEETGYVEELHKLSNEEYDDIFSENIIFLDVYTCSASNSIIEAIARATPILVNPLPPTIEYLGEDYPFYFSCMEEAVQKMFNMDLIYRTHEYLKTCDTRKKLTGKYFLNSFKESEVYSNL